MSTSTKAEALKVMDALLDTAFNAGAAWMAEGDTPPTESERQQREARIYDIAHRYTADAMATTALADEIRTELLKTSKWHTLFDAASQPRPAPASDTTTLTEKLQAALDTFDNAIQHDENCAQWKRDGMGDPLDCNCSTGEAFREIVKLAQINVEVEDEAASPPRPAVSETPSDLPCFACGFPLSEHIVGGSGCYLFHFNRERVYEPSRRTARAALAPRADTPSGYAKGYDDGFANGRIAGREEAAAPPAEEAARAETPTAPFPSLDVAVRDIRREANNLHPSTLDAHRKMLLAIADRLAARSGPDAASDNVKGGVSQ